MDKISSSLVTLLMCGAVYSQIQEKECLDKAIENGAGYVAHYSECDKFIQCQYNSTGYLQGHVRQCAFSTFWNNDLLTCVSATHIDCPFDKCKGQPDGLLYHGNGNCRGYWRCVGGRSVPMCCPSGHIYDISLGCVVSRDSECLDLCFNEEQEPETEPEVEPEVEPEARHCDKQPVLGNPRMYRIIIPGLFTTSMPCPRGTLYNHEACGCTYFKQDISKARICQSELHLTFDTDEQDQSGNNNHVINQNVTVEDGVAKFNGLDSKLVIPRFSNIDHTDTLVIRIRYSSNHLQSGYTQAIVSNSDCSGVPSIMLCEDDVNTYFGVGTTHKQFTYLHLRHQESRSKWGMSEKKLEYKFINGTLIVNDGEKMSSSPAPGLIKNVHCALHVGYAEALSPFGGEIDELEIYLCDPDL